MAQQYIDTGSVPNSVGGESLRSAFDKVNDNCAELDNILNPSSSYFYYENRYRVSTNYPGTSYNNVYPYGSTAIGGLSTWPTPSISSGQLVALASGSFQKTIIIPEKTRSGTHYIGIKINPTEGGTIEDTSWDFEGTFTPTANTSTIFTHSIDFNPKDVIGVGIKRPTAGSFTDNRFKIIHRALYTF